ncbi:MAG: DUF927 domain-containing protein [Selenomonadaceae bacterium]|nr:DUF927 domain-containing protein [Selenomonadaceae bacterium]MBR1730681.1 DUF927 domain-containing protein [Selenomonadaceae bacterium]
MLNNVWIDERKKLADEARQFLPNYLTEVLGITKLDQLFTCPFHADNTASMAYYADSQRVFCFAGCNDKGYDIFELHAALNHSSVSKETFDEIFQWCGLIKPTSSNGQKYGENLTSKSIKSVLSNSQNNSDFLTSKSIIFENPDFSTNKHFLTSTSIISKNFDLSTNIKRTPITPPPTAKKLLIDHSSEFIKFAADISKTDYWKRRGFSLDTVTHFNFGFCQNWTHPDVGKFPADRLIIPTGDGIHHYVARLINGDGKFKSIAVGGRALFNPSALNSDFIILNEGELDAASTYQVGFHNVVGLGGVGCKKKFIQAIADLNSKPNFVIIALDNDQPGFDAAYWIHDQLKALNIPSIVVNDIFGEYKDANAMLQNDSDFLKSSLQNKIDNFSTFCNFESPINQESINISDSELQIGENNFFDIIEKQIADSEVIASDFLHSIEDYNINSVLCAEALISAAICKASDPITFANFKANSKDAGLNLTDINSEIKKYLTIIKTFKTKIQQMKLQLNADNSAKKFFKNNPDKLSDFIIPPGYRVDDNGVFELIDGVEIQVSHAAIFISNEFNNIDDKTYKTQLACKVKGKWIISPIFDDDIVYDARKLIILRKFGVDINSNTAKDIIKYLEKFKAANSNRLNLIEMVSSIGWHNNKLDLFITPYQNKFLVDESNNNFIKCLTQNGDFDTWKNLAAEVFNYPIARFIFAACLAVPLLRLVGERSFVIYLWGGSRAGKTIACRFGGSAWGNQDIVRNFNLTQNALEGEAAESNDFPFILDEKQLADGNLNLNMVAYKIANEQGKGRMRSEAVMKSRTKWRTIGILNGETPLVEDTATQGVYTRTLNILVPDQVVPSELAKKLYANINDHFGFAGQAFIDRLINEDFNNLRNLYREEMIPSLQSHFPNHLDDHIRYVSLVTIADCLLNHYFFNVDIESAKKSALLNAVRIINLLQTKDEISDVKREWNFILGWIAENNSHFEGSQSFDNDKKPSQIYGAYKDNYLYINIKSLKDALEREKISYKKVLHDLANAEYIVPDNKVEKGKKNPNLTVISKINGVSVRCIRISKSKIE